MLTGRDLRRRPGFRAAFADFKIATVAEFTDTDRAREKAAERDALAEVTGGAGEEHDGPA
ncbi:hypothetical protein AB0A94_34725 [Streptomyces sp. NPDC044984]|uniref:hypothetical protein n=1 Tax=Streptomyces sp. NPDC044984 TaxID=3154335 RepID=UPI0033E59024